MIKITDILKQILLEEKAKRDRCLRIADRKFDKPSAYKSGAVVRCRQGSIWKGIKENTQKYINWNENYGKTFKIVSTPKGAQSKGEWNPDLVSIVTPENGGAWNNWKEVSQDVLNHFKKNWDEIQKSLGDHKYNQIIRSQQLNEDIELNEKESLNKWFNRQGAPGKNKGWVDCNTCRDGKCKPCGRAKGETRAKYPSCQPTPSACKRPGKGKTWGKTK
jgi:hypothetical protein